MIKNNKPYPKSFTITQEDLDKKYKIYDQFFYVTEICGGIAFDTDSKEFVKMKNLHGYGEYEVRNKIYIPEVKMTLKQFHELLKNQ
jgi:hypothetical protein